MGNTQQHKKKDLSTLLLFFDDLSNNNAIREVFDHYDKDKSGYIDRREYSNFIDEVRSISKGNEVIETYLEKFKDIVKVDLNHDGRVSYSEFLSSITTIHPQKIFLLGPGDSGKSTLLKQFSHWEKNSEYFIKDQSESNKSQVYTNIMFSISYLGKCCEKKYGFDDEYNFKNFKIIDEITSKIDESFKMTTDVYRIVGSLWKDSKIQRENLNREPTHNLFEGLE